MLLCLIYLKTSCHCFFVFVFLIIYDFLDPPPLPRVSIGLVLCVWKHNSPLPVAPGTCRCDQVPGAVIFKIINFPEINNVIH